MQDHRGISQYEVHSFLRNPRKALQHGGGFLFELFNDICWADVIHWIWGSVNFPDSLALQLAAHLKKVRVVNFCGSDIRIPRRAMERNPELRLEHPGDNQRCFARAGFVPVLRRHELFEYLRRDWFPDPRFLHQPVILEDFCCTPPDPTKERPTIVHVPSRPQAKGTPVIERVIAELQTSLDFDFKTISNCEHKNAQEQIRQADIVIDQLYFGDMSTLAYEGMALGKPVVTYIREDLWPLYPRLPVVNTDGHNLRSTLAALLQDGPRRQHLGLEGRAYVEQYHDSRKVAAELLGLYSQLRK